MKGSGIGARIEPKCIRCRVEDHWHSVMHGAGYFVGLGGEDGTGLHDLAVWIMPLFPQAGEREQSAVSGPDEVGLLVAGTYLLPFVIARRGDYTATPFERRAERRL